MWLLGTFFTVASVLLWSSVFGYLLVLVVVARRRGRRPPAPATALPDITVILPTRNEEALIAGKLDDLAATAYPSDRLRVLVVDGGSVDRTPDLVRARIAAGAAYDLLDVPTTSAKGDQVEVGLANARTDIVVITDADARLAPDCVRRLVDVLVAEPRLGAVAAAVEPATELLEERLHWQMQNLFWWAEGAAFDAAMGSAVALAFRRRAVASLPPGISADDVYIMRRAAEWGGARLCREALAVELRVPRTFSEFLEFRARRGADYRQLLENHRPDPNAPRRVRAVWALRRWHFRVFPPLAAATAASGALAVFTAAWPIVAAVGAVFAVSLLLTARWATGSARKASFLLPSVLRALIFSCSVLLRRSASARAAARALEPR